MVKCSGVERAWAAGDIPDLKPLFVRVEATIQIDDMDEDAARDFVATQLEKIGRIEERKISIEEDEE
jgi:hypothetical protein